MKIYNVVLPALITVFLAIPGLTGCADDDVGTPCSVIEDTSGDETGSINVNQQSLECVGRLCIKAKDSTDSYGLCTKMCESDDDCPGSTEKCPQGFACVVGMTVGPLKCCKMCVCKTPGVTELKTSSTCANFSATCPSI